MTARDDPALLRNPVDDRHLDALEEEAIFILREVAASFERLARPAALPAAARGHRAQLSGGHRFPRRTCRCTRRAARRRVGGGLDRHVDVSRGDWLGMPGSLHAASAFSAALAWLDTEAATIGRRYLVRHGNAWVQARLTSIEHRLDIHTLARVDAHELAVNDIGRVRIELQRPLPLRP